MQNIIGEVMRITSVTACSVQNQGYRSQQRDSKRFYKESISPAFKAWGGKTTGGLLGGALGGLIAIATMANPVGLAAIAGLLAAEFTGAKVGSKIGDKITGKDEEDK